MLSESKKKQILVHKSLSAKSANISNAINIQVYKYPSCMLKRHHVLYEVHAQKYTQTPDRQHPLQKACSKCIHHAYSASFFFHFLIQTFYFNYNETKRLLVPLQSQLQ